jgi:hypothetical protein
MGEVSAVAVVVTVAVIPAQQYDPQRPFFPEHKQTITHYTQQVSNKGYEFTVLCSSIER